MTENEAIDKLKNMRLFMQIEDNKNECKFAEDDYVANKMALQALEEVQQYRAIGTQEECKAAVEKQTAKKPEFVDTRFMNNGKHISDGCQLQKCYKCPNCNQHIFHVWDDELYCKYCGQHIDWRNEE